MNINRFLIFYLTAVFLLSCTNNVEPENTDTSLVCTNSTTVSFAADVQPVFTAKCAIGACHTTDFQSPNLSLGFSYLAIVNVPSTQTTNLVIPSDADGSYLYKKITNAPGIAGVPMPKTGELSNEQTCIIHDWINAGALNN